LEEKQYSLSISERWKTIKASRK